MTFAESAHESTAQTRTMSGTMSMASSFIRGGITSPRSSSLCDGTWAMLAPSLLHKSHPTGQRSLAERRGYAGRVVRWRMKETLVKWSTGEQRGNTGTSKGVEAARPGLPAEVVPVLPDVPLALLAYARLRHWSPGSMLFLSGAACNGSTSMDPAKIPPFGEMVVPRTSFSAMTSSSLKPSHGPSSLRP